MRCLVIGNAGGGKSTLARRLAARRTLPWVELDRLLWREGWRAVPTAEAGASIDAALAGETWVADGLGHPDALGARLGRATHAVLVDLPPWRHFALAARRDAAWRAGALDHPPAGQASPPSIERLFEMMWHVETRWMDRVRRLVDERERAGAEVVRVRDLEALDAAQAGLWPA